MAIPTPVLIRHYVVLIVSEYQIIIGKIFIMTIHSVVTVWYYVVKCHNCYCLIFKFNNKQFYKSTE